MTDLIPGSFWDQLCKYPLITVEIELCLLILLVLLVSGRASERLHRLRSWFRKTANHTTRAVILSGAIAIVAHLCALPLLRAPVPGVHDEFSYLLQARTFASGRLANPTHPLWVYFETFHIEHVPTYASMYPPAQGLALAAGLVLGNPIIGVWISTALFCAALCWMLQAWVPARWAFLGALIAVMRIGVFSYWANTYWGGSVPAIGGCLAWGAFGRIRRAPRARYMVLLGIGLMLLVTSRPYEGFWSALPIAAAMAWGIVNRRSSLRIPIQAILVLLVVLAAGGAWMAYYDWRVFGNPLTLPYTVNRRIYGIAPSFPWQAMGAIPSYHHAVMRDFYTHFESGGFQAARTLVNFLRLTRLKVFTFWVFFVGPALTLPFLVFLITALRGRASVRWPAYGLLAVGAGAAILAWPTNPHYYSPAVGCLYAAIIEGCRRLYVWRRNWTVPGRSIVTACLLTCLAVLCVRATAPAFQVEQANNITPVPWYAAETYPLEKREQVIHALKQRGGKHLVIVRYSPNHLPFQEYVYNDADIDNADIVWARELPNADQNVPLLDYFKGRSIWLYRPDESPYLVPYESKTPDPTVSHTTR